MKKRIFGIQLIVIIVFFAVMLAAIAVSVGYNRSVLDNWSPPEFLAGKWEGQSFLHASSTNPDDYVTIAIVIETDGKVTGKIDDAVLENCIVKQNRTWFEKLIGIKNDYMITGSLTKGTVKDDSAAVREIGIPFNLLEGELKGSIFKIEPWKYPDPLYPRILLTRTS